MNLLHRIWEKIYFESMARFKFFRTRNFKNFSSRGCMRYDKVAHFHGDTYLVGLVHSFFDSGICTSFVESGTFLGETSAFVDSIYSGPIFTFELNEHVFHIAQKNLEHTDIHMFLGNSAQGIREQMLSFGSHPLFYLDAHYKWAEQSPLPDELDVISHNFDNAIIIIDDFKVPGDVVYRHDVIFDFSHNPFAYTRRDLDFSYVKSSLSAEKKYRFFVPHYDGAEKQTYNGYIIIVIGENTVVHKILDSSDSVIDVR